MSFELQKAAACCLISLILLSSCTGKTFSVRPPWDASRPHSIPDNKRLQGDKGFLEKDVLSQSAPTPPWQVWPEQAFGSEHLQRAQKLLKQGRLLEAAEGFSEAEHSADSSLIKTESALRRASVLLQLGRSSEALAVITSFLKRQGLGLAQIDPRMGLVAAFSYEHLAEIDQELAWLGLVFEKSGGKGELARLSQKEARRVLRAISLQQLEAQKLKWATHAFVGPLVLNEQTRRSRGGRREVLRVLNWFSPETYRVAAASDVQVRSSDSQELEAKVLPAEVLKIGVLLPFSERYAEHSNRIKAGIDLAVKQQAELGQPVAVEYADTQGSSQIAAAEYEKLVQNGASFVLGPLLVKTAESVALKSEVLGVPLLTFTKRKGIPELATTVFRLGATASNQVQELVSFAADSLGLRVYAILYPESETGREFADSFRAQVARNNGLVVKEAFYHRGDNESMVAALESLYEQPPEALFIADSLENAWPMLELIKGESPLVGTMLLGSASWDDPVALRGFGGVLKGAVYVTPFFARSRSPKTAEFVSSYTEQFGNQPGLLSAQAFDAVGFLLSAVDNKSPETPFSLVRKLRFADKYSGVTGQLSVSEVGDIERRMSVIRLMDGEPVEVMAEGLVTGFVTNEQENNENDQVLER